MDKFMWDLVAKAGGTPEEKARRLSILMRIEMLESLRDGMDTIFNGVREGLEEHQKEREQDDEHNA